jgi:hypothetical protein
MKKRLLAALVASGALALFAPLAAAHAQSPLPSQSACVVITGPSGLTIQFGYAPNGPSACPVQEAL